MLKIIRTLKPKLCTSGSTQIRFPCLIRFNVNSVYKLLKPSNPNRALLGLNNFVFMFNSLSCELSLQIMKTLKSKSWTSGSKQICFLYLIRFLCLIRFNVNSG